MSADLERFYSVMAELARCTNQGRPLSEYTGRSAWPSRGVYFFREPGEWRLVDPQVPRIVRVGTHAITADSKSRLWGRLRAHLGHQSGGGNHRGSVFRLHVGGALIRRDGLDLATWGRGNSAEKAIRLGETFLEHRVSAYIGAMSVLWVEVPDAPGPASARSLIERNAVALLSRCMNPIDQPSEAWLGRHSASDKIRRSGLWNVNYVDEAYDPEFLDTLQALVDAMPRSESALKGRSG